MLGTEPELWIAHSRTSFWAVLSPVNLIIFTSWYHHCTIPLRVHTLVSPSWISTTFMKDCSRSWRQSCEQNTGITALVNVLLPWHSKKTITPSLTDNRHKTWEGEIQGSKVWVRDSLPVGREERLWNWLRGTTGFWQNGSSVFKGPKAGQAQQRGRVSTAEDVKKGLIQNTIGNNQDVAPKWRHVHQYSSTSELGQF